MINSQIVINFKAELKKFSTDHIIERFKTDVSTDNIRDGYILQTNGKRNYQDEWLSKVIYILYCLNIKYVFVEHKKKIIGVVPNPNWKPTQGLKTPCLLLHPNNPMYV